MSRKPVPAQSGERSRVEVTFDKPQLLPRLFGEYDANLLALEERLGVYITARGDRVGIEGSAESVARAREVLQELQSRVIRGEEVDTGLIDREIGCDVVEVYGDELGPLRDSLTPLADRCEMRAFAGAASLQPLVVTLLVDQMNGFVEQLQMRRFSNRNCIFVFPVFFMLLIISFEDLSRGETRPPRGTAYTEMGRSLLRRSLKMRQSRQRSIQPGDVKNCIPERISPYYLFPYQNWPIMPLPVPVLAS